MCVCLNESVSIEQLQQKAVSRARVSCNRELGGHSLKSSRVKQSQARVTRREVSSQQRQESLKRESESERFNRQRRLRHRARARVSERERERERERASECVSE